MKILVDASASSVLSALKSQMGEPADYLSLLNYRKKNKTIPIQKQFGEPPFRGDYSRNQRRQILTSSPNFLIRK